MNIDELFNYFCRRFEPEELSRGMLREWDDVLPPLLNRQNAEKLKPDCLNIRV